MAGSWVLSDVGGTNARFAVWELGGKIATLRVEAVADHESFEDALNVYLQDTGIALGRLSISAAGPVVDGFIQLTNAHWAMSEAQLSARFGGVQVELMNDLEAVASALPSLTGDDLSEILYGNVRPSGPRLAVNLGTGFGAAVAVPGRDGRWLTLATEAGHMRLDPGPFSETSARTVEDLFSGPGLAKARALVTDLAPGAWRRAYSRLLGGVVSDLVLATGAWGGVYLCGGLVDDFEQLVEVDSFRAGFRDDGAMQFRLDAVPVSRITLSVPAFRGLVLRGGAETDCPGT